MSAPTPAGNSQLRWNRLRGLAFWFWGFSLNAALAASPAPSVPPTSQEAPFQAKLIRTNPSRIGGLALDASWKQVTAASGPSNLKSTQAELPVKEALGQDGRPLRWVILRGSFKPHPDATLVCTYSYDRNHLAPKIKLNRENRFAISIPIQGDRNFFELMAVDVRGLTTKEEFKIDCPDCLSPFKKGPGEQKTVPLRPWGFTPAVGVTLLSYTETRKSPYSATLLTPKLGVAYALTEQWSLGASAFLNAVSLTSSDPAIGVRFLGLNARVGFSFQTGAPSWKTTLMLGAYSLGMIVSSKSLGFDRLFGPQIVVAERKTIDPKNAISAYAKYSTLIAGSDISLGQRELAGGLSYERRIGTQAYTASFDASQFDFNIGAVQIQSRTLTFSLGMNL